MKYSIGETVRIKTTGEKKKIVIIDHDFLGNPLYGFRIGSAYYRGYELKPYRPSRTGKYRNSKGQFRKECKLYFDEEMNIRGCICGECDKKTPNSDSKQRNYKKILDNIKSDILDLAKDYANIISKIEASQNSLFELEKKIDELGRKV